MSEPRPQHWQSRGQRDGDPTFRATAGDEYGPPPETGHPLTRRGFLAAAGFAFAGASLSGCGRHVERALPYLIAPESVVPGAAFWLAATCQACPAGCGLQVKCIDGRPIKLEGNPDQPISRGGLCAIGQASILGAYDSQRLAQPVIDGQPATWSQVDQAIRQRLAQHGPNARVAFLTGTVNSPLLRARIAEFLEPYQGRHVSYDALSHAAIRSAHQATHGVPTTPGYRFDQARLIVSFDCDFLGTWLSPVQFAADWRDGQDLAADPPRTNRLVQLESRLSLTGAKADRRWRVKPSELGRHLAQLTAAVAQRAGVRLPNLPPVTDAPDWLPALADDLWDHRGQSLVVCGSHDPADQILVNTLNDLLDNYGATLDLLARSYQRLGNDEAVRELLDDVAEQRLDALFVAGCNPLYDLPGAAGLANVPLLVVAAESMDETASAADIVCAEPHYLETWAEAEPVHGVATLSQPALQPFGDTRPLLESLAAWLGHPQPAREQIVAWWREQVYPRALPPQPDDSAGEGSTRAGRWRTPAGAVGFQAFWDLSLAAGYAELERRRLELRRLALTAATSPDEPGAADWELVLYPAVAMLDGRHAANPWLQELPDPITKTTWDNVACLSEASAAELGVTDGDVVDISVGSDRLSLPACIVPGQADRTVAVALGYGRLATGRFADLGPDWYAAQPSVNEQGVVGRNVAPLLAWQGDTLRYQRGQVQVARGAGRRPLALTQIYDRTAVPERLAPESGTVRPMIEATTLAAFTADRDAGASAQVHVEGELWPPDHHYPRHHWAMAIDLQACTGCSACVVACGIENNIPLVGRDEVQRRREMHWLRIDRYFSGDDDDLTVAHQPMLCHHCDNAPCEVVCPVLATVHSEEGLNQQVYNRCVGTRYCANNCPYKVRRFNWFEYPRPDERENLLLNPDVTVRSRGVMEKCTFCVQRIEAAKIEARREGRPVRDGDVLPACMQSCPTQAILFGDLNDPDSAISQAMGDPRRYQLLTELNIKPSVSYLRIVRDRPDDGSSDLGEAQHG